MPNPNNPNEAECQICYDSGLVPGTDRLCECTGMTAQSTEQVALVCPISDQVCAPACKGEMLDLCLRDAVEAGRLSVHECMAQAWDEGYRLACRDHRNSTRCETGDHGQRNVNPYRSTSSGLSRPEERD